MDWQGDEQDAAEFMRTLRTDLFDDEVYVFTPKGEVKTLPAGATLIDFAYAVHTDVGHRTVGAKVNGRIVPLHYRLKNGDFVEILTSKSGAGRRATGCRSRPRLARAQQDPAVVPARDEGGDRAEGARRARPGAQGPEPPVPQAPGLERARLRDPRDGLQEGGGLLPRARLEQDRHRPGRQQGVPAPQDRGVADEPVVTISRAGTSAPSAASRSGSSCPASRTSSSGSRSAVRRCPETTSSGTSRSGAGSRSIAPTAPTSAP